jgi:hypothetical protein
MGPEVAAILFAADSPEQSSFSISCIGQIGRTVMDNNPKRQEPDIMPPHPKEEPDQIRPEIPPDKDVPRKETPLRA